MLGFRISTFGWGDGYFMHQRKYYDHSRTFHACLWFISILFWHPNACQTCKRKPRSWAHRTKNLYFSEWKWKAYGTRCSQAVPHPSTILARRCLTSVIRRERVCSSWYGRRRSTTKCNQYHHGITVIEQATSPTWCEPNFLDRSELMSTDKKYQTSYSHWY